MNQEEKSKILIIETQQRDPSFQEDLLNIAEYNWMRANSEKEVMDQIQHHKFALILIKSHSPEIDGFYIASKIRRRPRSKHTPILLLTSHPPDERFTQGEPDLRPIDFIIEPIHSEILKSKIDLWVHLDQLTRRNQKLETELKANQEILDGVMNGVTDAIYIKDTNGRYLLVNAPGAQILGRPIEQIIGKDDRDFFSEESAKKLMLEDQLVIQVEKNLRTELTLELQGINKVFSTSKSPFRNPDGKIIGVIGISRDISEMKYFEEELRLSEERFRRLFEQASVGIQIFSPEGRCLQINQAAMELWNVDQKFLDYILNEYNILSDPQLESLGFLSYIRKGFSGELVALPPILYDTSALSKNGTSRWVESVLYPIKDINGKILEIVLIHSDVTRRIQAENTLKLLAESSTLLATSLEYQASLDKIAQLAVKQFHGWCIIRMRTESGELKQTIITHQDPKQALSLQNLNDQYPNLDLTFHGSDRVLKTGKPELIPYISDDQLAQQIPDQELFKILKEVKLRSVLTVPLAARGNVIGTMTLLSTKSSYHSMDLELAKELANRAALAIQNAQLFDDAQKAIQMRDDFLLVASHELRTPLTPLSLQIQTFHKLIERGTLNTLPGETLKKMMKISINQLQRLTALIESLLDVSQIVTGKLNIRSEVVNLSRLMEEILDRLSVQVAAANCTLELDISPNIVGFLDRVRIEEVLINLINNALKYGPGKPIRIKMRPDQKNVQISIQDFGPGISEGDQKRIFDRFERATSVYEFGGLGLGLYIAREIVQAHGGSIHVISHLNQGSTFIVDIPLVHPELLKLSEIMNRENSKSAKNRTKNRAV